MKLVSYRDSQMEDFIYFWVVDGHQVSPAFTDEESATIWAKEQVDAWDNWKPCKDIV